ncbi:MAG: CrcB family protein [Actinomycetota bacterium]
MRRDLVWLLVALGGSAGTLLRWAVIGAPDPTDWQWPVLAVNAAGALLLGWSVARGGWPSPDLAPAFGAGFCGGLTTMSTFAVDVAGLARDGHAGLAAWTLVTTVGVGIGAAAIGASLGRRPAVER